MKLLPMTRLLLAAMLTLGLLAAACGADDEASLTAASDDGDAGGDTSRSSGAAVETAEEAMDDSDDSAAAPATTVAASEAQADGGGVGAGPAPVGQTAAELGRDIIFTASVNVGVDDVSAAGREAIDIIDDVGGFLFGQNTVGGSEARSELTFKVFPSRFGEALDRLSGIGELRNQTISTDDVTERVVDLNSRIDVQQLGVERLRNAMENATDLDDFARLEALLISRETDLEVMRGTLRTLRDRVDLATITLTLSQDRVSNSVRLDFTAYEGIDAGVGCPGVPVGDLRVEEGTAVTLCFEVTNTGDQNLTDIAITETALTLENDDLIEVFGGFDLLAPGQSAIRAYEFEPERNQAFRLNVTATPSNGTDDPAGPAVSARTSPVLRATEAETDAGFGDGVDAGVGILASLWQVVRVGGGFLIVMLVLVPFLYVGWLLLRVASRKQAAQRADRAPRPPGRPPNRPAAQPAAAPQDRPAPPDAHAETRSFVDPAPSKTVYETPKSDTEEATDD